jgi:hypothetical protein
LYQAIQKQDWKTMFYLTKFSEAGTKGVGNDPDGFARGIKQSIDKDPKARKSLDALFGAMSNLAVGTPTIRGKHADVPTSATVTAPDRKVDYKGIAHLIDDNGVWKWDLTATDDVDAATNKGMTELLGKAVTVQQTTMPAAPRRGK